MVQEGVYTFESVNDAFAEPVIYMIDHFVVGGFYRVHTGRGHDENLNAPGHAVRAARLRGHLPAARSGRQPGLRAEPLLCVRRGRAPRAAAPPRSSSSRWRRQYEASAVALSVTRREGADAESAERSHPDRAEPALRLRSPPLIRSAVAKRRCTMKLAFVLDPLDAIKTYKDSSYAMMEEAARRGHELSVLHQEDILCRDGVVSAHRGPIRLTGDKHAWYALGETARAAAVGTSTRCSCARTRRSTWSTSTAPTCWSWPRRQGARVVNRPRALRDYNEKFSITRFPQFTVPTLVTRLETRDPRVPRRAQSDIVLKPLDGMGGASVFRLHRQDPNIGVVIETLTHYGRRTVMAQRYIPEIVKGDKRILLIDGKPAPYRPGAHSRSQARRAATSPPADAASRSRCRRAIARSPRRSARCWRRKGCCWSGST